MLIVRILLAELQTWNDEMRINPWLRSASNTAAGSETRAFNLPNPLCSISKCYASQPGVR